jgi:hypothetical protein
VPRPAKKTSPVYMVRPPIGHSKVMLPFSGQNPHGLGFAIREEIEEALVDALDGLEEFIDSHGLASYFVCG